MYENEKESCECLHRSDQSFMLPPTSDIEGVILHQVRSSYATGLQMVGSLLTCYSKGGRSLTGAHSVHSRAGVSASVN